MNTCNLKKQTLKSKVLNFFIYIIKFHNKLSAYVMNVFCYFVYDLAFSTFKIIIKKVMLHAIH